LTCNERAKISEFQGAVAKHDDQSSKIHTHENENDATMLATLTLAGWAQAGETGSIVIYRQAGMIQPFSSFPFNINHGPRMKVSNGRYVRLNLVPGDYTISHDHWGLIPGPEDPQRVHVDAGKTVYFQYTAANPFFLLFEVADDQEKAAKTVATMKEMK
jgi:hypothetical protein